MAGKGTKKTTTLRDRKKAQPKAVLFFSDAEKATIKETIASSLDYPQFKIFVYTCQALGLNPLLNEICAVIYKERKTGKRIMSIQVMRDGFLTIAHRSGKFAGMRSGVKDVPIHVVKGDEVIKTRYVGWAKVYHHDFKVPVYQEADFEEYDNSTRNSLWTSKPKTMIKKVAESMALRKAFNVSGVYASEEMEKEIVTEPVASKVLELEGGDKPASETQLATIKALDVDNAEYYKDGKPRRTFKPTKQEAADIIKKLSQKKGKKK